MAWDGGLPAEARCLLTIQHRMHPQISAYISRASYEGQLQDAPEVQAYEFVTRKPLAGRPPLRGHGRHAGKPGAPRPRGCACATRPRCEWRPTWSGCSDERCPRELSMAVIAMYAEQVERLRQALGTPASSSAP